MTDKLLERTIEMLKWSIEDDEGFLQWSKDKPENERDEETIEHLSWLIEECTDIVNELTKLKS